MSELLDCQLWPNLIQKHSLNETQTGSNLGSIRAHCKQPPVLAALSNLHTRLRVQHTNRELLNGCAWATHRRPVTPTRWGNRHVRGQPCVGAALGVGHTSSVQICTWWLRFIHRPCSRSV